MTNRAGSRIPEGCLSELRFDRWLNGELDSSEADAMRTHLSGCERCTARLAHLEKDRDEFRRNPPPLHVDRPTASSSAQTPKTPASVHRIGPPSRLRMARWGTAFAAAAALTLVAHSFLAGERVDGTRSKGRPKLGFYVKHGDGVIKGASGEIVAPQDSLRFTYTLRERRFFTVISVDGVGRVSIYFPVDGRPWAANPGTEVPVPASTVLDEALGRETLFGVFCETSAGTESLRSAVEANPLAPVFPRGCEADRVEIVKRQGDAAP